jgi:hypothetical protein
MAQQVPARLEAARHRAVPGGAVVPCGEPAGDPPATEKQTEKLTVAVDVRDCDQCGTSFVPRREHARFCSADCREAWNRGHAGDPHAGARALQWSITAMTDTTRRLTRATAADQPRAAAVISEGVWWVTIVDATLIRHHPDAYDDVMARYTPAERRLVDGTLAGLRFVRNGIAGDADLAEFVGPGPAEPGAGNAAVTRWTWRPVPEPAVTSLPPRGQAWEISRYRAYHAHLAGHAIGETFGRAAAFLNLAAATADRGRGLGVRPWAQARHRPDPPAISDQGSS